MSLCNEFSPSGKFPFDNYWIGWKINELSFYFSWTILDSNAKIHQGTWRRKFTVEEKLEHLADFSGWCWSITEVITFLGNMPLGIVGLVLHNLICMTVELTAL